MQKFYWIGVTLAVMTLGVGRAAPSFSHRAHTQVQRGGRAPDNFWGSIPQTTSSVDIAIGGYCQGTPVENAELRSRPGFCRTTFFTAAHCTGPGDMNIRPPGVDRALRVPRAKMRVISRTTQTPGDRTAKALDSALISVVTECYKLAFIKPVQMRPPVQGISFELQKRTGALNLPDHRNSGGGGRIRGQYTHAQRDEKGISWSLQVPAGQGGVITGADSGGGIFQNGFLVGALSGSSNPRVDPRTPQSSEDVQHSITFDPSGIQWAQGVMAGFEPTTGPNNGQGRPDSPTPTPTPTPTPVPTPPTPPSVAQGTAHQVKDRNALKELVGRLTGNRAVVAFLGSGAQASQIGQLRQRALASGQDFILVDAAAASDPSVRRLFDLSHGSGSTGPFLYQLEKGKSTNLYLTDSKSARWGLSKINKDATFGPQGPQPTPTPPDGSVDPTVDPTNPNPTVPPGTPGNGGFAPGRLQAGENLQGLPLGLDQGDPGFAPQGFPGPQQQQFGNVPPGVRVRPVYPNLVSVDGVRVPPGATGYYFVNGGRVQWVFGNGTQGRPGSGIPGSGSPSFSPGQGSPIPPGVSVNPIGRNVVSIGGRRVPPGATGWYWRGGVHWVFGNGHHGGPSVGPHIHGGDFQPAPASYPSMFSPSFGGYYR